VYFFLKRGKKVRPLLSRWDDSLLPAHSPLCVPLQCSCIHLSTLKSLFVKEKKAEVRVVVSVESESSSTSSNNNKHDLAFLRCCPERERERENSPEEEEEQQLDNNKSAAAAHLDNPLRSLT